MKKKIVVMLTGVFAASMLLSGCEASKGLETDNLTITQYKGVEVDEVDKPEEVTDEDVEAAGEEVGMEDVAVALAGGTGEEADGDGGVFQKGG